MVKDRIAFFDELVRVLESFAIYTKDVCLLGSCTLAINEIRKNNDIEFALHPKVRERIEKQKDVLLHMNKYSRVIKFSEKIENCVDLYKILGITDEMLFTNECSTEYGDIRIVNPDVYTAQLFLQNREKDEKYIGIIKDSWLWNEEFELRVEKYLDIAQKNGMRQQKMDRDQLWISIFFSKRPVYIFGTGNIGEHVYRRVARDGFDSRLSGFVVSEVNHLEREFCNKEVMAIDEVIDKDPIVLVAVLFCVMPNTIDFIRKKGIRDVIPGYQFWIA